MRAPSSDLMPASGTIDIWGDTWTCTDHNRTMPMGKSCPCCIPRRSVKKRYRCRTRPASKT